MQNEGISITKNEGILIEQAIKNKFVSMLN